MLQQNKIAVNWLVPVFLLFLTGCSQQVADPQSAKFIGLSDLMVLPGDEAITSTTHRGPTAIDLSADGSTIVSEYPRIPPGSNLLRWKGSETIDLDSDLGSQSDEFYGYWLWGVSADGSAMVGRRSNKKQKKAEAFLWRDGSMIDLGDLPEYGYPITAMDVSADGSVVVGQSTSARGTLGFRWEDGEMIAIGTPSKDKYNVLPQYVSADGKVIVGIRETEEGSEVFRWENGDMIGLGDLPGGQFESRPRAISADGSVIIGTGNNHDEVGEAFRWEDGSMVGLGVPFAFKNASVPGRLMSASFLANTTSADGSVIVISEQLLWTKTHGIQSFNDLLSETDVELDSLKVHSVGISGDASMIFINAENSKEIIETWIIKIDGEIVRAKPLKMVLKKAGANFKGWELYSVQEVSHDSLTIVGYGKNPNKEKEYWIARLNPEDFDIFSK